jgi:hypothetical protein
LGTGENGFLSSSIEGRTKVRSRKNENFIFEMSRLSRKKSLTFILSLWQRERQNFL